MISLMAYHSITTSLLAQRVVISRRIRLRELLLEVLAAVAAARV